MLVVKKDYNNARLDLEAINIRWELWLHSNKSKPEAPFSFNKQHVKDICKWVSSLKLRDGYIFNISWCSKVKQLKINGFKSHDCYVFMQKLILIAFREMLPKKVVDTLTKISNFFWGLCSTIINYSDVKQMENILLTMCKLEMISPPRSFDSMDHTYIHLAYEFQLGGLMQYRACIPLRGNIINIFILVVIHHLLYI